MNQKSKTLFKLIVPSLLGVLLFLVPLNYNGSSELVVGIMGSWLKKIMGAALIPTVVIITVASAFITVIHKIVPIPFIKKNKSLDELFSPDKFWFSVRIIGGYRQQHPYEHSSHLHGLVSDRRFFSSAFNGLRSYGSSQLHFYKVCTAAVLRTRQGYGRLRDLMDGLQRMRRLPYHIPIRKRHL